MALENNRIIAKQIRNFIIHLRLHYQFFILSGGFLMASLFVESVDWKTYVLQFLNVHILLFGGATAFNSYWDKDEGAVGGLKNPPKMQEWMRWVSLLIQFIGLGFAMEMGTEFLLIYMVSMIFFWLYSTPQARWKGKPILSLIAIGISTGTNSFLLGYLAAGGESLGFREGITAFAVAVLILSMYPVSQIFQIKEDEKRGDLTFALRFGLKGIRWFYRILFLVGLSILSFQLYKIESWLGISLFVAALPAFGYINWLLGILEGRKEEYQKVMRIKFLASFSFVIFAVLSRLILSW